MRFFIFITIILLAPKASGQRVIAKPIPNNPTSYRFAVPIKDARFYLEKACLQYNNSQFGIQEIYYNRTWKKSSWPKWTKELLAIDSNKYDVILNFFNPQ